MPTYEYYCPANQKTLEVMHSMSRSVSTWGELCELADAKPGKTAPNEPVEKLLSAGMVISSDKNMPDFDCGNPGGCCGGGACSM
ncbi:MAG: zinc ribbon domain-containing protein [Phycisphaeraceae bacterium]|jgi:hypothetical protein